MALFERFVHMLQRVRAMAAKIVCRVLEIPLRLVEVLDGSFDIGVLLVAFLDALQLRLILRWRWLGILSNGWQTHGTGDRARNKNGKD
jgi:hypothetical protein